MAEYDNATALVDAATKARLAGYRKMDAYSPIPIHEMDEALGLKRTRLPLLVLIGGILGGLGGFSLESWASAIASRTGSRAESLRRRRTDMNTASKNRESK